MDDSAEARVYMMMMTAEIFDLLCVLLVLYNRNRPDGDAEFDGGLLAGQVGWRGFGM